MREILFRGKIQGLTDWSYGYYAKSGENHFILLDTDSEDNYSIVNPETVGEWTGMTDKNGVKIFEGDIVKFYDTIHKVVFETKNGTAYFGIKISDTETWGFGNYVEVYKLEVIGNIYDNPELLEVKE